MQAQVSALTTIAHADREPGSPLWRFLALALRRVFVENSSLVVSTLALVATIVSNALTIARNNAQDINAKKDVLHAIVHQHSTSDLRRLEINKAENDRLDDLGFDFSKPESAQNYAAMRPQDIQKMRHALRYVEDYNAHFALATGTLARQAFSLVNELGAAAASVDLADAAMLSLAAKAPNLPEVLYRRALERAVDSAQYLGAARGLAKALFLEGRTAESRAALDAAIDVSRRFPREARDADRSGRTQVETYLWGVAYVGSDDCALAGAYLSAARSAYQRISGAPASLAAEIAQAQKTLPCPPPPFPAGPSN